MRSIGRPMLCLVSGGDFNVVQKEAISSGHHDLKMFNRLFELHSGMIRNRMIFLVLGLSFKQNGHH